MFNDVFCRLFELNFNESLLWNILVVARTCLLFGMIEYAAKWTIMKINHAKQAKEEQEKPMNVIGFH